MPEQMSETDKDHQKRRELEEERFNILKNLDLLESQIGSPVRMYGADTTVGRANLKEHFLTRLRNINMELDPESVPAVDSDVKK